MKNKIANLLAAGLLVLMGILAFTSIIDDSLTYDEVAHIGAGYTYWHNQDYRLKPGTSTFDQRFSWFCRYNFYI